MIKRSQFTVMNDIMNDIVTFFDERMTPKRSQSSNYEWHESYCEQQKGLQYCE